MKFKDAACSSSVKSLHVFGAALYDPHQLSYKFCVEYIGREHKLVRINHTFISPFLRKTIIHRQGRRRARKTDLHSFKQIISNGKD